MACFSCKSADQYFYIVDALLAGVSKDLKMMHVTIRDNNVDHGLLTSVVLLRNEIDEIRRYVQDGIDRAPIPAHLDPPSAQEIPSESDIEELFSSDFDVADVPESPVFRPASDFISPSDVTPLSASPSGSPGASSSVLPRSDACSDLSLSGPLKKIKKLNDELAKKNPGTFITKKDKKK